MAENAYATELTGDTKEQALATAITDMRVAIRKGYVPTHERALLEKYLDLNGFGEELDRELEILHPVRTPSGIPEPPACSLTR